MRKPLKVLIVEDSETDALLLLRALRQGGFEPTYLRVDNAETLNRALFENWEIVLCDYKMPGFDGVSALKLFREKGLDIPFIVVSGQIGEDVAVGMMKAGAHDYLLKDNMARLVPAIERELREAQDRRQLRRAQEARAHLAALVASSDDGIISTDTEGVILTWNRGAEEIFGYPAGEVLNHSIDLVFAPKQRERFPEITRRILRGERADRLQTICVRRDCAAIDVSLTVSAIKNSIGQITAVSAIARDITERKRAEAEREKILRELQSALTEVKTLSGLLPICASCKKIRDDQGYWQQVEIYIKRHSRAEFTHGFCPECLRRLYPQFILDEETHDAVVNGPRKA
jgi:PAS domain S-box-containing protein